MTTWPKTIRGWVEYALFLLPLVVILQVIDTDSMPFWKGLLIAVAIGSIWGLALGAALMILRRVRHGVWSRTPVESYLRDDE